MYITIAIGAYLVLAIVAIFDKFIVDKSVPRPILLTFYSTVSLLPLVFLTPFGTEMPSGLWDWSACIISGFGFSLALWASYRGLQDSEVSHLGPLIGASTPFFVFLLGAIFLPEVFSSRQLIAIGLLILGSLIISLEQKKNFQGWHGGVVWGVLAGFLFAASHIASKYIYGVYGFYSGLIWTRVFMGVFGVLLLASPTVRGLFSSKKKNHAGGHSVGKQILLVGINKLLGLVGVLLEQYAIAIGSVTVVNALVGVQYGCLVLLVILLSFFWPKLFREEYARGEIAQEIFAVAVIAMGLWLLI
ncbi:MAG: DMT family transporter [Candidatus Magasanikbacteria bacterium]|jgi:drug/metabolite transporter (DMT)-like permease